MALSNFQFSYRGITMGEGTNYDIIKMEGLHDLIVKDTDRDNPRSQGTIPGIHSATFRLVRCTLFVRGTAGSTTHEEDIQDLMDALSSDQHMQPSEADDQFTFKFPGEDEKFIFCRPVRRSRPRRSESEGGLATVRFELKTYDPRTYSTTEDDSGYKTSAFVVVNNGGALAYPILEFDADSLGGIQIDNSTNGASFSVAGMTASSTGYTADMGRWVRGRGDLLIIYKASTNHYAKWQIPRDPFYLDPGSNSLTVTTSSNGQIKVKSRDTWM